MKINQNKLSRPEIVRRINNELKRKNNQILDYVKNINKKSPALVLRELKKDVNNKYLWHINSSDVCDWWNSAAGQEIKERDQYVKKKFDNIEKMKARVVDPGGFTKEEFCKNHSIAIGEDINFENMLIDELKQANQLIIELWEKVIRESGPRLDHDCKVPRYRLREDNQKEWLKKYNDKILEWKKEKWSWKQISEEIRKEWKICEDEGVKLPSAEWIAKVLSKKFKYKK